MAQQFQLEKAKTELEQLRAKRRDLSKARSGLEDVAQRGTLKAGEQRAGLSKLDSSIEEFRTYKSTIADLSASVTDSLQEYVNFASHRQSFEGIEKLAVFFRAGKWAHRHRVARIAQQGPKENLKMVLAYAADLVTEIREVQGDAMTRMESIQGLMNDIVDKVAQYEPLEEKLKEKVGAMEAEYAALEEKNKNATPSEQAKYAVDLNEQHQLLVKAHAEYDEVLTVYNQAKQALQPNREALQAFEQMVRDLGIQAVQINEKMVNIEQIYKAAPEAIEIMMKTKGMENLDQAMNVAAERSLAMITEAAIGVTDATVRRQEAQVVTADFMREIMGKMYDMSKDFKEREEAISASAHQGNEARYGV